MEVDETPRATGRFDLDRIAHVQISRDRDMDLSGTNAVLERAESKPLAVDVALPGMTPCQRQKFASQRIARETTVENPREPFFGWGATHLEKTTC